MKALRFVLFPKAHSTPTVAEITPSFLNKSASS